MHRSLEEEARRATSLLRGQRVAQVWRHRPGEIVVEFEGGARLFVDSSSEPLELSITGIDEAEGPGS